MKPTEAIYMCENFDTCGQFVIRDKNRNKYGNVVNRCDLCRKERQSFMDRVRREKKKLEQQMEWDSEAKRFVPQKPQKKKVEWNLGKKRW